jgi:hypothetical protein
MLRFSLSFEIETTRVAWLLPRVNPRDSPNLSDCSVWVDNLELFLETRVMCSNQDNRQSVDSTRCLSPMLSARQRVSLLAFGFLGRREPQGLA